MMFFLERTCTSSSQVTGASGYIAHQEFPNSVLSLEQCNYNIAVPSDKRAFLSFKVFGLEDDVGGFCDYQYTRHNFDESATALEYSCGCKRPNNIGSTTNSGFLRFVANKNDLPKPGFLAYYKGLGTYSRALLTLTS